MADMKNKQLQAAVETLGKNVAKDSGAIRQIAADIRDAAKDTARVAEQIAGLGVDPASVAETRELAQTMGTVSTASDTYASAADTTARMATAAVTQVRTSHDGIHEAVSRAPVDVSGLNRQWVTPE